MDSRMASHLATHVSTVVLGLLFILPGIVKTVRLNTTLYREMLKTFKNFTEVSPLRHIGVIPSPQIYMQSMGVFELLLGTTLVVGHVSFKKFACLGIMALMLLTTYCQVALKDYSATIVPCGYFCLLSRLYFSLDKLEDRRPKNKQRNQTTKLFYTQPLTHRTLFNNQQFSVSACQHFILVVSSKHVTSYCYEGLKNHNTWQQKIEKIEEERTGTESNWYGNAGTMKSESIDEHFTNSVLEYGSSILPSNSMDSSRSFFCIGLHLLYSSYGDVTRELLTNFLFLSGESVD
ncbi:ZMYM6 neighbor [Schistosoma haematobium]|uniref:ZMYM6 neighbor n=1 Tax=Schistosoma haematobium TaxID=6185 RepID=A0A6A5DSH4_SCHHA|nr:ZMYM6 neighbor [Schistosoma haematobium]KAH9590625.1 ZMYM6 neighbor [Schistosoma haematobium]